MNLDDLREKREEILALAAKHGAGNVRVFGSVARGEAGPESDVDFIVEYTPGVGMFDHIAFMQHLEELLGRRVDVATERTLHWFIREQVLSEAVSL